MFHFNYDMNRFGPYIFIFIANCIAYAIRWGSGLFSTELNLVLFVIMFLLISALWESIRGVNIWLNKVMPFEQGIPKRIAVQLILGVVVALFIRFLVYYFGEPLLPVKLDSMFVATTWALYSIMSAAINSIFIVRFFIDRWKDSIIMAERLEKEKSIVQFDNLKNQLNPHFLFNALTSLNSLISENPTLASQFLHHMSRVYRYVLQNKDKNYVAIGTELEFISKYIFLVETRFRESIRIKVNVPASVYEKAIVPVTLQILIENAIKHNIVDSQRPLSIEIYTAGDYLIVGNNLQLRKIVETSNKQGLENLRSLYRFLTDKPIEIEETDQRFNIKIPLL
ncbi:MAG: histidine kinase [Cyclobacteriaceae bacterium]|nr:histidine kinase [Cyclobacteriaceae bacterium]